MANTIIQLKRSFSTGKPGSLANGEIAYSYTSNTLFIGGPGAAILNIGGQYYTSQIDSATSSNTASTIVKRDAFGQIVGGITGNANSATYLGTPHNFSISGGDVTASALAFNGSQDITLNASLTNTGVSAGTYGSASVVPVITVAANGRLTTVTTATIPTAVGNITVTGNTGSSTYLTGNTLSIVAPAGSGISTAVTTPSGSNTTVTISTDSTLLRSNTTAVGPQFINTDLTITGNLSVQGSYQYTNTAVYQTVDSLIELAANNNIGDVVDIGFYGLSNTNTAAAGSTFYHGLIRAGTGGGTGVAGNYYLFKNLNTNPTGNVVAYAQLTAANTGNLVANIVNSTITNVTVASLASALAVKDGGTGSTTAQFTAATTGNTIIFNGTSFVPLANALVTGTPGVSYGASSANSVTISVDAYGRITAIANDAIAIDASAVTTGTLPIARGGTNNTTFTTGALTFYNGTQLASFANSTFTATGTSGLANNTVTSLTVDAYGRLTAATYQAIAGLTVGQGGTGLSTATLNGIVYGNGTAALGVTAAAGTSDQTFSNQLLTVNASNVPVWTTTLDGGGF